MLLFDRQIANHSVPITGEAATLSTRRKNVCELGAPHRLIAEALLPGIARIRAFICLRNMTNRRSGRASLSVSNTRPQATQRSTAFANADDCVALGNKVAMRRSAAFFSVSAATIVDRSHELTCIMLRFRLNIT